MGPRVATETRTTTFTWAVALILGGLVLLLFNLDVFASYEPYIQYVFAGVLALAGLTFFASYASARTHWWRLIPAWTLLSLAVMVFLSTRQEWDGRVTAALLFWGQTLAFLHIYLLDRGERWWALIPGGFLLVVGGVIALSSRTEDPDVLGTALFVGMGLVFFLLYLLGQRRRDWWALIPGAVLVLFGIFLFSVERSGEIALLRWWPLLPFFLGIFLAWRAYRQTGAERLSSHNAPSLSRRGAAAKRPRAERDAGATGLGNYRGPAPGASVEILPESEEK